MGRVNKKTIKIRTFFIKILYYYFFDCEHLLFGVRIRNTIYEIKSLELPRCPSPTEIIEK